MKLVSIDSIVAHPDNPRIALRDDIVSAIAANLVGEFPKKYAIHVRTVGDKWQLLSGHQRTEAARRAGLTEIWAWVDELDDDAAFMELVTSNNQGELSPLEIGIHALKAVPKEKGGRGKKGGLSEYAAKIGKTHQYVSQLLQAADVATQIPATQVSGFLDKSKHLCAIHDLPRACWQAACEWLATANASVADVEKRAEQTKTFVAEFVAGDWKEYLPVEQCAANVFSGTDPGNFRRLLRIAGDVESSLLESCEKRKDEWYKGVAADWRKWLIAGVGGESWSIDAVQKRKLEIDDLVWEHESREAPADKVELILADPPWRYDFAETDNRKIENQYPSATTVEICQHIDAKWAPKVADNCVLYLWATAPKLLEALSVMKAWGFDYVTSAVWDKEKIGMGYWFRGQHELLLVGTKGKVSPPEESARVSSVFREARGRHSEKPDCVYAAIEAMFPNAVKCEFYQRKSRDGWIGVGNES